MAAPNATMMVPVMLMHVPVPAPYPAAFFPQSSVPAQYCSASQNVADIDEKANAQKPRVRLQNKKLTKMGSVAAPLDPRVDGKKRPMKLENRKLGKDLVASSRTDLASPKESYEVDAAITTLASRRNEQLLRLALAALGDTSCLCKSAVEGSHSTVSLTTKTTSFMSTTASTLSSIDEESLPEWTTSTGLTLLQTPRPVVQVPRIGIDIGGVLLDIDRNNEIWEVKDGVVAVRSLLGAFGVSNVFLVSKVRLGGRMHRRTLEWLQGPNGFLERAGLPAKSVVFVRDISGPHGKGAAASTLGLSHFVDNKWEVLQAVFTDKAGNSGDLVQRFDGILFHFATGGSGRWKPKCPAGLSCTRHSDDLALAGNSDMCSIRSAAA
jgi:hypothetical protein